MTQWTNAANKYALIDTAVSGITQNGTYYLEKTSDFNLSRTFLFGAYVKQAGHTATIQLFAEVAYAQTLLLDVPLAPTYGVPDMAPDEYTFTGKRGIIVTNINGTVYPEVSQ